MLLDEGNKHYSSAGLTMADHAVEEDFFDGDIFIYRGGPAPQHITHACIDKSLDEIEDKTFYGCYNLAQVETHDGLRKVGEWAFRYCRSLKRINLKYAVELGYGSFYMCRNLESVEFGDVLETIGNFAFRDCYSLKTSFKLPSIITVGIGSFGNCTYLSDVELSERLQTIGECAFYGCKRLQRVAIPLKRNLFVYDDDTQEYSQFDACEQLVTIDLVGQAHTKTIASLHMESWRTEMIVEINRINQVLPNTRADDKSGEIRQWMESLLDKMDHYKAEHVRYVKEGITLLELALWKAKLGEKEDDFGEGKTKKAKIDTESARKEKRITCGAETVIKIVLPFLQLE